MMKNTISFPNLLSQGLLLLFVVLTISACKKDPVACYNPNRLAVIPGKFVTFFNCSQNATSYKWDFGNGASSMEASPFTQYNSKGTYNVMLEAANDAGDVNVVSKEVLVGDPGPLQIIVDTIQFPSNAASALQVFLDGEELVSTTVTPLDVPFAVVTSATKKWTGNSASLRVVTTLDDFTVNFDPQTQSNADMIVRMAHAPFWSAYVVLIGR